MVLISQPLIKEPFSVVDCSFIYSPRNRYINKLILAKHQKKKPWIYLFLARTHSPKDFGIPTTELHLQNMCRWMYGKILLHEWIFICWKVVAVALRKEDDWNLWTLWFFCSLGLQNSDIPAKLNFPKQLFITFHLLPSKMREKK